MEIDLFHIIIGWVSTVVVVLGAMFAAFGFLLREMRRGLEGLDKKFEGKFDALDQKFEAKIDGLDKKFEGKFEGLRADLTAVKVGVARIEGHLGIGFPAREQEPAAPPERAA